MRPDNPILRSILDTGIIAIVRLSVSGPTEGIVSALIEGGIRVIEFPLTNPGAVDTIHETSVRVGDDALIGAGTVLSADTAREVIEAGAQFIVSPSTHLAVIEATHALNKVSIPGAYTPTEIVTALDMGADLVKLFPANQLGPEYVKAIKAPLPDAPIVPTGGVRPENVAAYVRAGACAVAVGAGLVSDTRAIAEDYQAIRDAAATFRRAWDEAVGQAS